MTTKEAVTEKPPVDDPEQAEMAALWSGGVDDEDDDGPKLDAVEISIEGDKAEVVTAPEAVEEKEPEPAGEPDEGKAELQRQFAAERARAQEAERRAQAEQERAQYAERTAVSANVSMLDTAIANATAMSEKAQAKLAKALEAGDFNSVAAANVEIVDARNALWSLHGQKQTLEAQMRAPPPQQQQALQQPQGDQTENIALGLERGGFPKSAAWVRLHSDLTSDAIGFSRVQKAASIAEMSGLKPDSTEYLNEIERILGMRETSQPAAPTKPTPRPAAPRASAPPTPAPARLDGQTERVSITLTPRQRAMAREMDMTDLEYAKEFYRLQREGKMGANR